MPTATKTKKKTIATPDITIPQKALINAIDTVISAVPSRPSHPVFADLLVEIGNGAVSITAFDLAIGIKTKFTIENTEFSKRFCIPAKFSQEIISRLGGDLGISFQENSDTGVALITVSTSSAEYKIPVNGSVDDFPELPTIDPNPIVLPSSVFLDGLKATRFSISTDESKQVLNCIKITGDTEKLELASTDGHRLSVWTGESVGEIDFTLPYKAADAVTKKLNSETIAIRLDDGKSQAQFNFGDTIVTARLIEGSYPNYRQLIPKQFASKVTCDRASLLQSLERVGVVADAKNGVVVLAIEGETIVISCDAPDYGSAREEVEAELEGKGITLAFNVKYLTEGLKAMKCDRVLVHMNSPTSPAAVRPVNGVMEYLVMPVQIKG